MRATGEVMGLAECFGLAYFKAQQAAGLRLPLVGTDIGGEANANTCCRSCRRWPTSGSSWSPRRAPPRSWTNTASRTGPSTRSTSRPNIADLIKNREVSLIINTPLGRLSKIDDNYIRMLSVNTRFPT